MQSSMHGKKSVGVLFRQVKEAHSKSLISEYKFHESQLVGHNQSNTIAVTIHFLPTTSEPRKARVIQYIRNNFRVLHISQPDRSPRVATIYLNILADTTA